MANHTFGVSERCVHIRRSCGVEVQLRVAASRLAQRRDRLVALRAKGRVGLAVIGTLERTGLAEGVLLEDVGAEWGAALRRMGAAWKCLGNFSICETNLSFTTRTLTDHRETPTPTRASTTWASTGTRRQAAALVTYVSWRRQCDIGGRPAGESPSEPGPTRPSSRCECTSGLRHGSPSWRCGMPRLRRVGVLRGGKSIETPCPGS
jgi:hypothetical protein